MSASSMETLLRLILPEVVTEDASSTVFRFFPLVLEMMIVMTRGRLSQRRWPMEENTRLSVSCKHVTLNDDENKAVIQGLQPKAIR